MLWQGAHGVEVSYPLRMRKALGSIPSVSMRGEALSADLQQSRPTALAKVANVDLSAMVGYWSTAENLGLTPEKRLPHLRRAAGAQITQS